jgi:hypothetical protein
MAADQGLGSNADQMKTGNHLLDSAQSDPSGVTVGGFYRSPGERSAALLLASVGRLRRPSTLRPSRFRA